MKLDPLTSLTKENSALRATVVRLTAKIEKLEASLRDQSDPIVDLGFHKGPGTVSPLGLSPALWHLMIDVGSSIEIGAVQLTPELLEGIGLKADASGVWRDELGQPWKISGGRLQRV